MEEYLAGLSEEEAGQRRERGEGEKQTERITKSVPQIIKDNLFTLFNFLNFLIAALLFVVERTPTCCSSRSLFLTLSLEPRRS